MLIVVFWKRKLKVDSLVYEFYYSEEKIPDIWFNLSTVSSDSEVMFNLLNDSEFIKNSFK